LESILPPSRTPLVGSNRAGSSIVMFTIELSRSHGEPAKAHHIKLACPLEIHLIIKFLYGFLCRDPMIESELADAGVVVWAWVTVPIFIATRRTMTLNAFMTGRFIFTSHFVVNVPIRPVHS
jgi:hypothetical protein